MTEETLAQAVDKALSEVTPHEHHDASAEVETEASDATAADETTDGESEHEAAGDKDEAGDSDTEAGKGVEGSEAADSAGRERNPDGTFKTKAKADGGKADAAEKPADKAADKHEPKAGDAKKQTDPLNDPIPKDVAPATQERIRSLVKSTKEITADRDRIQSEMQQIVQGVASTGTTPEQFGEVLGFLSKFNSPDPAAKRAAIDELENFIDRASAMLGIERRSSDPLAGHQDLISDVNAGKLTREYARQIAVTRNGTKIRTDIQTQHSNQQQQSQQRQQELDGARQSLNDLENSLKASDPQYSAKRDALVPVLQPLFAKLPPREWKAAFEQAYARIQIQPPRQRQTTVPTSQPMRGKGNIGAGDLKQEPSSMLDAVSAGIAAASRR